MVATEKDTQGFLILIMGALTLYDKCNKSRTVEVRFATENEAEMHPTTIIKLVDYQSTLRDGMLGCALDVSV